MRKKVIQEVKQSWTISAQDSERSLKCVQKPLDVNEILEAISPLYPWKFPTYKALAINYNVFGELNVFCFDVSGQSKPQN